MSDSLSIIALIEEGEKESDTILQLQKFERALILSRKSNFNYGMYTLHKRIAEWKKEKYNTDSTISQYKKGIKDLSSSKIYNYNLHELVGLEYTKNGKYDSALFYLDKSIKISNRIDLIGRSYMGIGNMWLQKYDYSKAFISYTTADSIFENSPKFVISKKRAQVNNYLGFCVRKTHGDKTALKYFNISKKLYLELNNTFGVQEVNIAIAQVETALGNFDSALNLLNESIDYHQKHAQEANSYSYSVIVRGFLLVKMGKIKDAEKDYKLYYDLAVDSKNRFYQIRGLTYLGDFYTNTNQFQKAIDYFKSAIKECQDLNDFNKELKITEALIKLYKKNNDLSLALEAYDNYIAIQKKVDEKDIKEKTFELEAKYQTEKKEQEITLLKSQKEIIEQQNRNQKNLMLGGIGITTIAGLFLFFLYRNHQKTNTKLKELDALKSNFFTNISHEFRTPLTLITSPIDDMISDDTISDKKRQQFTVAKQNSNRLLELVNQILDLSKIDAGHLKLYLQQGNVLQLVSALSESFSYSAKQKNIRYTIDVEQSSEAVWYDKDAVEKITINLLSNALKYTPENGTVSCKAYVENNRLFLTIKNSGKGLTSYELKNIFERFYQTNDQNQGSGIGLALVKELVELHNGKIEVQSKPNGETSFSLNISLDKKRFKKDTILIKSKTKVESGVPLYTSASIEEDEEFKDSDLPILLIVEDNNDLRSLLKQSFENNYNVITAPNGKIGVELALEHIPDLIISDIMMPEKDGITLSEELKTDERSAHIPIILLTAKAEVESQYKGIGTGADDYISKPFDKKLLALKVEKLIESRRQLQLRYSQELVLLPKDIAMTNLDEKFLEKVQLSLDQSLTDPSFNVTEFSEAVGMSRMQLHRKLKALTGLTASEFIRSQRLKLATEFLKSSDINISQIGYSVGFNDHSYFAKCFKEVYNCSPTDYANKHT
ncbi:response regulator [Winogradskyella thalassocola]|uniref:histidine kinase n=1 Tax=Winogradskyella thalassocola TaxID=262004 RepID=A0A1G8BJG5_9FLAO|nr:response regulator [Winogradskyella thalassocola]SDH33372.1 Tetratricopeptide repeat-containing protein [Winogradskyella thalassocola]